MNELKKYKICNIALFCLYTVLFVFEIIKVCIYSSLRELTTADFQFIAESIECFFLFLLFFVFMLIYHKSSKLRKTSLIFAILCVIALVAELINKIKTFSILYFPTEVYTPSFMDKFTSLFELCYISLFSILFITYFAFLIHEKHFHKSS